MNSSSSNNNFALDALMRFGQSSETPPASSKKAVRKRSNPTDNAAAKKKKKPSDLVKDQARSEKNSDNAELNRMNRIIEKLKGQMQERTRQKKVHINFCVSADSQRSIDNDHVKYLAALHRSGRVKLNTQPIFVYPLPARDNFDGSDFEEFSPAGDNQLDGQRFAILDGQHRWAALKSLSDEHYPSSENYRLMSVIVFDETITSEEQQYVKNFGDLNIGKKLEFNDVDLVNEIVRLRSINCFFQGLRGKRHGAAKLLKMAKVLNPHFQEFHLIIGGMDEHEREPLTTLMKKISAGVIYSTAKSKVPIKNTSTLWRKLLALYIPDFDPNRKFFIDYANRGKPIEELVKALNYEGSRVRRFLDDSGNTQWKVFDFFSTIGIADPPTKSINKFLDNCDSADPFDEIVKKAKEYFSCPTSQRYTLDQFMGLTFTDFDFVYIDLRYFAANIDQLKSWLTTPDNFTFAFLRDTGKNFDDVDHASTELMSTFEHSFGTIRVVDLKSPPFGPLRESVVHVVSGTRNAFLSQSLLPATLSFQEVVAYFFEKKRGVWFVGSSDAAVCNELDLGSDHVIVFRDETDLMAKTTPIKQADAKDDDYGGNDSDDF